MAKEPGRRAPVHWGNRGTAGDAPAAKTSQRKRRSDRRKGGITDMWGSGPERAVTRRRAGAADGVGPAARATRSRRTNRATPLLGAARIARGATALVLLAALMVAAATAPAPAAEAAARDTVLRIGSAITVFPSERIAGDLVVVGAAIDVLGTVDGDVVAIGGSVAVDGAVGGDVVAIGGNIRLGPHARVFGDVWAVGGAVFRDAQAMVRGRVGSVGFAEAFSLDLDWLRAVGWRWLDFPFTLLYIAGLFALAVLVTAVVPANVQAVAAYMETNPGRSMVIGFLALMSLVPLTVVLVLTIIGPPLLWLGFLAAKFLGYVALVSLVGRLVAERLAASPSAIGQLAIGVGLVALVRYVPILGPLFSLVATAWSLGAVLDTKFGTNRPWLPPRQAEQEPS